MKRLSIILLLLCAFVCAHAQVQIKEETKRYEFYGRMVVYWYNTGEYELYIHSDNQFEDKTVRIPIGKTTEEAYQSLEQIYSLYNRAGSQFDIGGYTVVVDNVCSMRVLKHYDLKYTAGTYYIPSHHLIGSKNKIKRKMNMESKK